MPKLNVPGSSESGFLAALLVDELINTLKAKKILSEAEHKAILNQVLVRCDQASHVTSRDAALIIRQALDGET